MSEINSLDELREEVDKLKSLLDDPHPGLMSWSCFFVERMHNITSYWHRTPENWEIVK
jgi:hypothetical protein